MRNSLIIGIGFALGAVALALVVIIPVFIVVNWIYDDGKRLTPLMIVVVVVWLVLATVLRRRHVAL